MHFKWTSNNNIIFIWNRLFRNIVKRPTHFFQSIFKISSPNFQDCFFINWATNLWRVLSLSDQRKILWLFTWSTSSPYDDITLYMDCDAQSEVRLKCSHRFVVWPMCVTSKILNCWSRLLTKNFGVGRISPYRVTNFCSFPLVLL